MEELQEVKLEPGWLNRQIAENKAPMTLQRLHEAFWSWKLGDAGGDAILFALRDPTPITEEGLRGLGFSYDDYTHSWEIPDDKGLFFLGSRTFYGLGGRAKDVKTLGQLRRLFLGVQGDGVAGS